jgi:hypothetical protein
VHGVHDLRDQKLKRACDKSESCEGGGDCATGVGEVANQAYNGVTSITVFLCHMRLVRMGCSRLFSRLNQLRRRPVR